MASFSNAFLACSRSTWPKNGFIRTTLPPIKSSFTSVSASSVIIADNVRSVFESPEILSGFLSFLLLGVGWIVPYYVFNVFVAPALGLTKKSDEEIERGNEPWN